MRPVACFTSATASSFVAHSPAALAAKVNAAIPAATDSTTNTRETTTIASPPIPRTSHGSATTLRWERTVCEPSTQHFSSNMIAPSQPEATNVRKNIDLRSGCRVSAGEYRNSPTATPRGDTTECDHQAYAVAEVRCPGHQLRDGFRNGRDRASHSRREVGPEWG